MGLEVNWIFLLVCIECSVKVQYGISFLLVLMDSLGIEVWLIFNLELYGEFCEVFFNDVWVFYDSLVGGINQGWSMVKVLFGFEWIFFGLFKQFIFVFQCLECLVWYLGLWYDFLFVCCFVVLSMDLDSYKVFYECFVECLWCGESFGLEVFMLKIFQFELFQCISELGLEVVGEDLVLLQFFVEDFELYLVGIFIQLWLIIIYGGSNEIQCNILVKSVFGLLG